MTVCFVDNDAFLFGQLFGLVVLLLLPRSLSSLTNSIVRRDVGFAMRVLTLSKVANYNARVLVFLMFV